MTRVDAAAELFSARYSCSQSVFVAFAPSFDVDRSLALRLSSALGGGVRAGGTCGAALGALLVLGLAYCDSECSSESRREVMEATDAFHARFTEQVGDLSCPGILGCDIRDPEQRAKMLEAGHRESICLPAVRAAAEILEDLLATKA